MPDRKKVYAHLETTGRCEHRGVSVRARELVAYFSQCSRKRETIAFRSLAVTRYAAQSENRRGAEERF